MPDVVVELGKTFAVFILVAVLALGLRHLAFRALGRWFSRTVTVADEAVLQSLRLPSLALCVLLGLYIALDLETALRPRAHGLALKTVWALLVVSVTAATVNFFGAMLAHVLKQRHLAIPATGLTLTIIKGSIWLVGLLVLLGGLGVSIAPMIAALGIGGLAVSLALQDTLSNFFAGIHLLLERPVRLGDFVKLESGQEGYVENIGWRTTQLRAPSENLVIIPNRKMIQSILIKYAHPERSLSEKV